MFLGTGVLSLMYVYVMPFLLSFNIVNTFFSLFGIQQRIPKYCLWESFDSEEGQLDLL